VPSRYYVIPLISIFGVVVSICVIAQMSPVFAGGKMSTCPKWSGLRDQRAVLEGVGIVDHAYFIALLSFVVVLMLDLAASRPVRREVRVRAS
jgi:hypothetical protein